MFNLATEKVFDVRMRISAALQSSSKMTDQVERGHSKAGDHQKKVYSSTHILFHYPYITPCTVVASICFPLSLRTRSFSDSRKRYRIRVEVLRLLCRVNPFIQVPEASLAGPATPCTRMREEIAGIKTSLFGTCSPLIARPVQLS